MNFEGRGPGLIKILSWHLPEGAGEKQDIPFRIAGVRSRFEPPEYKCRASLDQPARYHLVLSENRVVYRPMFSPISYRHSIHPMAWKLKFTCVIATNLYQKFTFLELMLFLEGLGENSLVVQRAKN
jgi:hypothetical protein